jgi:hypothetical protein
LKAWDGKTRNDVERGRHDDDDDDDDSLASVRITSNGVAAAVVVVAAFMSFVEMKSSRWPFTPADSLKNPLENKSGRCAAL